MMLDTVEYSVVTVDLDRVDEEDVVDRGVADKMSARGYLRFVPVVSSRAGSKINRLISAQGANLKIRQFNFNLTFTVLICKGNYRLILTLAIVSFRD